MSKHNYPLLILKGCAMGAADVVPGVSGGTIAFIAGIYEELVDSIKSINLHALKLLFTLKLKAFWQQINGSFLFSILLGIGISIFSLAKLMTWLLEHYPIQIWSFFFGLIIASTVLVAKEIQRWHAGTVIALIIGAAVAYVITILSPSETPNAWWFIILSGAIAICAMILPGISGAFILLLMGKYAYILGAVSALQFGILLLFAFGAVTGIVSFSHLLSWLLKKHHTATVATLTGFMVGSLNKVWPWKETLETYTDSHGAVHPLVEANISPAAFEQLTGTPSFLWQAILLCIFGFVLIFGLEYLNEVSCGFTASSATPSPIPALRNISTNCSGGRGWTPDTSPSNWKTSMDCLPCWTPIPICAVSMSPSPTKRASFPTLTTSVRKPPLSGR